MSKLARQLGLPSIPPALRPRASCGPWNSRCGRRRPRRCRSAPPQRTTGADYDTEWARSKPARMARRRSSTARCASQSPASHRRIAKVQTACSSSRAGDLRGQPSQPPRHPTPAHIDPRAVAAQDRGRCSCRLLLRNPHHRCHVGTRYRGNPDRTGEDRPQERRPRRRTHRRRLEPPDLPEGGRSPDGWGQPFRGGAAYLAARAGVPVVPVHVAGTGRILRKGARSPPEQHLGDLRSGDHPCRQREHDPLRRPNRARGRCPRRRGNHRLVLRSPASHRTDSPSLTGPEAGQWRRAWALGDRSRRARSRQKRWPEI